MAFVLALLPPPLFSHTSYRQAPEPVTRLSLVSVRQQVINKTTILPKPLNPSHPTAVGLSHTAWCMLGSPGESCVLQLVISSGTQT